MSDALEYIDRINDGLDYLENNREEMGIEELLEEIFQIYDLAKLARSERGMRHRLTFSE